MSSSARAVSSSAPFAERRRHIPNAELRLVDGDDHAFLFEGSPHLYAAVRDLLRRGAARSG